MITKRQYNILSFYLTRALFLGGGLSLLVSLSKNDLLFSGIVGMLLGYVLLYLFFKKGRINNLVSVIIACSVLFMNALSNTVLTSTYLLYSTPICLITLIFFITLIYTSKFKFSIIGRICEVFIVVASIEIFLAVIGLIPFIEIDNTLPMFSTRFINIIKGIVVFTGASLLPNLLLLNYKENLKFRDIHFGYIVGSILMILVLFLIISIYGSEFASITRFPEFMILKKIDIMGYFNNIENVLVTEWMINILICSMVCIKVIKDRCSKLLFYILVVSLFLITNIILNSGYVYVLYIKNYFYYFSFILVIGSLIIKKSKI